jgi:hypothetical protein
VAADPSRVFLLGHIVPPPYEEYGDNLPKSVFPSRPGLETMLRRLVLGNGQYPNIKQVVGTVTGVRRASDDPTRLGEVTVRTKEGEMTLPAALVAGQFILDMSTVPHVLTDAISQIALDLYGLVSSGFVMQDSTWPIQTLIATLLLNTVSTS